ncbi:unnamed protein product [Prorocentrum cordatum]|uniref:S1 motif domain-containing protein n=2 Tax=Prorocentrum cordatum TaxID=2364126 RepID=A0ABN9UIX1_9DINO|nr:unnamed protein product [Polarella glacialis]
MKKYPIPYDSLKVGQEFKGIVRSMSQFGAFVDIGAKNPGLLHRSSVTANEINNTRWLLKANQEVKVWISGLTGDGQFSLTMIEGQKDIRVRTLKYGQEFQGTVHSVTDIGAFVDIGADNKGLLHISAISKDPVEDIHSVLKEGQEVKVWVSNLRDDGRFLLTMTDKKTPPIPFDSLKVGQEFQGTVRRVGKDYSFVDIGATVVGLLHKSAISTDSIEDISSVLQDGQEVKVWISGLRGDGKVYLTMVEGKKDKNIPPIPFDSLRVGQEFWGTVNSLRRHGAYVDIGAEREGLLHISAISKDYIEKTSSVSVLKGDKMVKVWISDLSDDGKFGLTMIKGYKRPERVERESPKSLRKVAPFSRASPDEWFEGRVLRLLPFGVFILLKAEDGTEAAGLCHVSQVARAVSVGQKVKVRVLGVDVGAEKMSLSMLKSGGFESVSPDKWLTGKVVRCETFGAFVEVTAPNGATADGLVHISQIKDDFVRNVKKEFEPGQEVKVRVINVDVVAGKMILSMKPPESSD